MSALAVRRGRPQVPRMRLVCVAILVAGCGDMTSHAPPMHECTEDCGSRTAQLPQGGLNVPSPAGTLSGPAIGGGAAAPIGAPAVARAGPAVGLAGNAGGAGGAANGGGGAGGAGGAANSSAPPVFPDAGFGPGGAIR
jgi:hypothetical protein